MNTLPFSPSSISLQRVVLLVLASTFIALLIAAAFASPVEATRQCQSYYKAGCCDTSWPSLQDKWERWCRECWLGTCTGWWLETQCRYFSICG